MLAVLPTAANLGAANPLTQHSMQSVVSQEIRTNNFERLEAKAISDLKESAENRRVREKEQEQNPSKHNKKGNPDQPDEPHPGKIMNQKQEKVNRTAITAASIMLKAATNNYPVPQSVMAEGNTLARRQGLVDIIV